MVYQLCIRSFGREKLEGIMTTAQILVSVAAVICWQVIPRMGNRFADVTDSIAHSWWIVLLPPAWFAGFDEALAGTMSRPSLALGLIGVIATASVLWIAFVKLARDYQAGLQRLLENVSPRTTTTSGEKQKVPWPTLATNAGHPPAPSLVAARSGFPRRVLSHRCVSRAGP